jgi:CHAD domain-containing protein
LRNPYKVSYLADLYNAGGKIRETQINRQILQAFEGVQVTRYKGFRNYLKIKDRWAVQVLKSIRYMYSYRRIKSFEDKLTAAICLIPDGKYLTIIDQFIQNKINNIELLVADQDVESKLHKIRKYIKSIKYLFEMIQISSRKFGNLYFEIDKITILEDMLGDWHDYYEFRAELEEYIRISGKGDQLASSLKKVVEKEYNLKYREAVQLVYKSFKIKSKGV